MSGLIALRDYQDDLINRSRPALSQHKRIVIQSPTGTGKTAISVTIMAAIKANKKTCYFLVNQKELLDQTSGALWRQRVEHGMIAAGKMKTPHLIQVATIQTLTNRLDQYPEPDLIVIDECHTATSPSYLRVIEEAYPNSLVIGLSATPQRTDGKALGLVFNHIIKAPQISWFIEREYLCDYRLIGTPIGLEQTEFKRKGQDFDQSETEQAMDKPKITGNAVDHWIRHGNGQRNVVMCTSIKHAEHVRDTYLERGIPAECIEGSLSGPQRKAMLDRFRNGETKVITNVQLLVVGVDIPNIAIIQWLRPTGSLIVWMQGNGRGFRMSDGKEYLTIFDHVGNWQRHGLPDQDRDWTLEGTKGKGKKGSNEADINIAQCKKCFHVFKKPQTNCPACGVELEAKMRVLEEVEGDLVEIKREEIKLLKKQNRIEQGMSQTIDELVALGVRRGIKKPAAWAAITLAGRHKKKPSPQDFRAANEALIAIREEIAQ